MFCLFTYNVIASLLDHCIISLSCSTSWFMFLTDKSSASSFYPHQSSSPTWSSHLLPAQRGRSTRIPKESRRMTRQSMMTTRKSCSQKGCTNGVIKEGGVCIITHGAKVKRCTSRDVPTTLSEREESALHAC